MIPSPQPGTILIAGPTAVGKTALAVALAQSIDAEIISADAMQIYRGLEILSAAPASEERAQVPHHLVGVLDASERCDAARWLAMAEAAMTTIHARGKTAILCGGTGLYFRAYTHGLATMPPHDPAIRAQLETLPLPDLQVRYAQLDPDGALRIDLNNPRRLIRAIEVSELSGKPFSSFLRETIPLRTPPAFFLTREKNDLYRRIDARVETMFKQGLEDEVRHLQNPGDTANQAIGLADIQLLLAGKQDRSSAISSMQQATRRYAKRQLTWFRRETQFQPLNLSENSQPLEAMRSRLVATHE